MTKTLSWRGQLWMAAGLFLLVLLASLPGRAIHIDDSWFAEQAWWLANEGVVRSRMFAGLLGYEAQQFAYHKLHIWQDALFLKLFGFSATTFKMIPLLYLAGFFVLAFFYLRRYFPKAAGDAFAFVLAFLLVNALVVEHVYVNRPEIMIMFLGFASFFLLRRALEDEKGIWLVAAGVLAGLAALTHLNGASFIGAGTLFLLWRRRYRMAAVFLPASLLAFGLYFIDILPGGHFQDFLYQFRHDPALAANDFHVMDKLLKLFEEHKRFFRHPKEIAFSLLFLSVFWIRRRAIREDSEPWILFVYLLCLFVVMGIISPGQKDYYLIYEMPYIAMLCGVLLAGFTRAENVLSRGQRRWLLVMMSLYVLINLGHTAGVMRKQAPTPAFNAAVVEHFGIERGDRVIAPLSMIFNQLPELRMRGVGSYFLRARMQGRPVSGEEFFAEAARENRRFVLIETGPLAQLGVHDPEPGQVFHGYRYLGSMLPYHVLQRQE